MKKNYKKIISFFVVILIFTNLLSAVSFASESESQDSIKEIFNHAQFVEITDDGQYIFKSMSTPENVNKSAFNEKESKSCTLFSITPENQNDKEILDSLKSSSTLRSGGGSNYAYAWDSTAGVKIYTTVYYTEYKEGTRTYVTLDKITGGYDRQDKTLHVVSQTVSYGATNFAKTQNNVVSKSGTSWTIYPPSSWSPVDITVSKGIIIGATLTTEIKRNSSPWTVQLKNNPYEAW